jgi:transposase-like protein
VIHFTMRLCDERRRDVRTETRTLLKHYVEHGTSKSALARELGVSRDTIYRWIGDDGLGRDLDAEPVRYGPTGTGAHQFGHRVARMSRRNVR